MTLEYPGCLPPTNCYMENLKTSRTFGVLPARLQPGAHSRDPTGACIATCLGNPPNTLTWDLFGLLVPENSMKTAAPQRWYNCVNSSSASFLQLAFLPALCSHFPWTLSLPENPGGEGRKLQIGRMHVWSNSMTNPIIFHLPALHLQDLIDP